MQDNLTFTVDSLAAVHGMRTDRERFVSYLPLSHITAAVVDIFLAVHGGASVYFTTADPEQVYWGIDEVYRGVE